MPASSHPAAPLSVDLRDPDGWLTHEFNMLDANKDGSLSSDELFEGLIKRCWEQDEISVLFDMMDANKDGRITLDEYLDAMHSLSHVDFSRMRLDHGPSAYRPDDGICILRGLQSRKLGEDEYEYNYINSAMYNVHRVSFTEVVKGNIGMNWRKAGSQPPFQKYYSMFLVPARLFKMMGRIRHLEELQRMGYVIEVEGQEVFQDSHCFTDHNGTMCTQSDDFIFLRTDQGYISGSIAWCSSATGG